MEPPEMRDAPLTGDRVPGRQVRAAFDARTVTVYQAYSPAIAEPAVAAGRFVSPFKFDRMTWIKPSFLWMMYRSGWATKPDQERVLAVSITRDGFEWTVSIADVTRFAHEIRGLAAAGDEAAVSARLSAELPYPLPVEIRSVIGAA